MSASTGNIIDEMVNSIKHEIDQLKEGECEKHDENFSLSGFWFHIDYAVQIISNEVSKISLHFSKPPYPNAADMSAMIKDLKLGHIQLITVYHTLSKQQGVVLLKEVTVVVQAILAALLDFVRSLKDLTNKGNKDRLTFTGTLWDACNAIKEVPKDNLQATLVYLKEQSSLVCDALQEIEEEIKQDQSALNTPGDVDNSETWNNPERELASSCLGIIKTARSCLKRVQDAVRNKGSCEAPEFVCQLDELCDLVKGLSPAIDDFIQEIYPPMNMNTVRIRGADVALVVYNILNHVEESHYITDDITWVDFLRKAVAYNNNKLQPLATVDPVLLLQGLHMNS